MQSFRQFVATLPADMAASLTAMAYVTSWHYVMNDWLVWLDYANCEGLSLEDWRSHWFELEPT